MDEPGDGGVQPAEPSDDGDRERVAAQIEELQGCLDLVSRKVAMYEEHLAADGDDPLWAG
ncbi:MerR family transcriptional regulator [Actinomadura montaniterrae]|uniref:hypothetical protein n=1 Tax=Actinomadura montaniterrae TaxID=1803903 RepID=UPI00178C7712|nr:hypothetical protein [Actinomadura montaniterrae]